MAELETGDLEQALKHFEAGSDWTTTNAPQVDELRRLQLEASQVFGIEIDPTQLARISGEFRPQPSFDLAIAMMADRAH